MIQKNLRQAQLEQKTQSVTMLLILTMILLLVQLWLVTIAIEEFLAEKHTLAIPTFLASAFCFALNFILLKYLYDIDK